LCQRVVCVRPRTCCAASPKRTSLAPIGFDDRTPPDGFHGTLRGGYLRVVEGEERPGPGCDPRAQRDGFDDFDVGAEPEEVEVRIVEAAIQAAIALHAGIIVDYDEVAGWWQFQDYTRHAFEAAVLLIRVAAEHTQRSAASICEEIAARRGASLDYFDLKN
jgi:hypothetical protein